MKEQVLRALSMLEGQVSKVSRPTRLLDAANCASDQDQDVIERYARDASASESGK